MKAKIGDVVIDKTYNKKGNLAIVVGEGISQPILIDHNGGIARDKLRDYFAVWDELEVIGHIDFERIWEEAVLTADRKTDPNSSEKPNNSTISKMEQVEDEPQTELVNDSPILAKDLVDDEFNPYDEECMRCKHLKLQCEFVPSYCKYEPRDETQTEEPPMDEYYKDHDEFYEPQERSSE